MNFHGETYENRQAFRVTMLTVAHLRDFDNAAYLRGEPEHCAFVWSLLASFVSPDTWRVWEDQHLDPVTGHSPVGAYRAAHATRWHLECENVVLVEWPSVRKYVGDDARAEVGAASCDWLAAIFGMVANEGAAGMFRKLGYAFSYAASRCQFDELTGAELEAIDKDLLGPALEEVRQFVVRLITHCPENTAPPEIVAAAT